MQLLAEERVVDAPDEGALVLQTGGRPVLAGRAQVGPLQGPIQVTQGVGLGPALRVTSWVTTNDIISPPGAVGGVVFKRRVGWMFFK